MTRDAPEDAEAAGSTRRRVLAGLGTTAAAASATALAGCATLPGTGNDEPLEFHTSELPDVPDDPGPALWPTYPVTIPPAHLRDAQRRTNDMLESLPTPLGKRRIPNGHVREHLTDAAVHARTHLDDAVTAPTQRASLQFIREARQRARYAAAGWAAIDDGLTEREVRDAADAVQRRAIDAHEDHAYVGTDPVPATVVHASLESLYAFATDPVDSPTHDAAQRVLHVAGIAGDAERARAALADATTVRERFRRAQPDDASSLRDTFASASDAMADRVRAAAADLPRDDAARDVEGADIEDTLAERVLRELHQRATWGHGLEDAADRPASAVVSGVRALAAIEAYLTVRRAVADGRRYAVEDAADVTEPYERAHDALATAPADSPAPGLARAALVNVASSVQFHDEQLARHDGMVQAHNLERVVVEYVVDAATAEHVDAGVEAAVDALEG
jgi:hypothetical protein